MKKLTDIPACVLRGLKGILFDLDDTFTSAGQITASAYGALCALSDIGVLMIPVTGRPAGWCDMIARMWPVSAVIGENGAFYFAYDHETNCMRRCFERTAQQRTTDRQRLQLLCEQILKEVPGARVSADQSYRETDLAIDFCEDVSRLDSEAVDHIVRLFRDAGASAKVSSIHVNGWFGEYDKLTMTRRLFTERFGLDLDRQQRRFAFVGDSPNDAPMFEYFSHSIGVANVLDNMVRLPSTPSYVTQARSGDGFAEFAHAILATRA